GGGLVESEGYAKGGQVRKYAEGTGPEGVEPEDEADTSTPQNPTDVSNSGTPNPIPPDKTDATVLPPGGSEIPGTLLKQTFPEQLTAQLNQMSAAEQSAKAEGKAGQDIGKVISEGESNKQGT